MPLFKGLKTIVEWYVNTNVTKINSFFWLHARQYILIRTRKCHIVFNWYYIEKMNCQIWNMSRPGLCKNDASSFPEFFTPTLSSLFHCYAASKFQRSLTPCAILLCTETTVSINPPIVIPNPAVTSMYSEILD